MKIKQFLAQFRKRSVQEGLYRSSVTALVLALIIAINIFVGTLPTEMTEFDLTSDNLYTLSQPSKDLMNSLEETVTLYWIVQPGVEDDKVDTLLDRYAGNCDRIIKEKLDPDLNPTFIKSYPKEEMNNNGVLVTCGDRYRYVDIEEIYKETLDYNTYQYVYEFNGEDAITSAIDYVTSDNLPTIGLLTGHAEAELDKTYASLLTSENILTKEVPLAAMSGVPEDVDLLLINQPTRDISAEEAQRITQFVQRGGDLMLVSNVSPEETYFNLYEMMGKYGMSAVPGVVFEGNAQYYYNNPNELIPNIHSHGITEPLISSGGMVLLADSHGISTKSVEGASVVSVLETTRDAYSKTGAWPLTTALKENGDLDGPFSTAAAYEKEDSRVLWVGCGYLMESGSSAMSNNLDFFMNSINWMSQRENRISIRPKSMEEQHLVINAESANTLKIVLLGVIPVSFLAVGLYIYFRRKGK
ncbi:MAG: GldG family protein [Oscillospiraceae bacterium]|nr:GldG family protein [Oscillospiraceae bacterium]